MENKRCWVKNFVFLQLFSHTRRIMEMETRKVGPFKVKTIKFIKLEFEEKRYT